MCIIIVKPKEQQFFNSKHLKESWKCNPDGFGMAISREDDVLIVKGKMSKRKMLKAVRYYCIKYPTNTIALHFRRKTTGSVCASNCHPYPISNDVGELKALEISCKYALAHNGVITGIYNKKRKDLDLSDTQEYILDYIYPARSILTSKAFRKMWELHSSSKFIVLASKNKYFLIGDFSTEEGYWFSNKSYVKYTPSVIEPWNGEGTGYYSGGRWQRTYLGGGTRETVKYPSLSDRQAELGLHTSTEIVPYDAEFAKKNRPTTEDLTKELICSECGHKYAKVFMYQDVVIGDYICWYCKNHYQNPNTRGKVYVACVSCEGFFDITTMTKVYGKQYRCADCEAYLNTLSCY